MSNNFINEYDFSDFIKFALLHLDWKDISRDLYLSEGTIRRYVERKSVPHPLGRISMVKRIIILIYRKYLTV